MKQASLFAKEKPRIRLRRKAMDAHAEGNQRAALVILGDPEKYGGEGSLAVSWARIIICTAKSCPFDCEAC